MAQTKLSKCERSVSLCGLQPDRLNRAEHIVESAAKMMSPAALRLILTYDQSEDECVERAVRFLSEK
jgi:hypothetical protein